MQRATIFMRRVAGQQGNCLFHVKLALRDAFGYRAATRVDTLGGNAAEGRLIRRLSTFGDRASARLGRSSNRKEMP